MPNNISACYVNQTGLFQKLDDKFLNRIAKKSKIYNLVKRRGKSQEFPIEGKVYIVHEGMVFLSCIDEAGKKIILDILSPGSVFGDLDFNDKQKFSNECLFIEPFGEASVCEMQKSDFKEILKQNPDFAISLLSNISNRLVSLEQKVGTLVFSDVEARLIAQMVELAESQGKETKETIELDIKITHEKLSEMIGSARETVSDAVSTLKKKGVLEQEGGKYKLSKEKLRQQLQDG